MIPMESVERASIMNGTTMSRLRRIVALLLGLAACSDCARKADDGAWQPVRLTTDATFNDIGFADDHNGWVVGGGWDIEGGIIGRTHDGGQTWSVVMRTEDGGMTWAEEARAPGEELRALFVAADGRSWTVGDRVRHGGQVLLRRSSTPL